MQLARKRGNGSMVDSIDQAQNWAFLVIAVVLAAVLVLMIIGDG